MKRKIILRKIKSMVNMVSGGRADRWFWKFRHIFDNSWATSYISEESIKHPHRKILISAISNYGPFDSVLEIGCASGPNLFLLSKKFEKAKLYGIDISAKAIKTGVNFFKKEGIKNVFLNEGGEDYLSKLKDKTIDIIFTDAVLMYEPPKKIENTIEEMGRVAKKAIILCEQHSQSGPFYQGHWIHNYKNIIDKIGLSGKIEITRMAKGIWTEDWEKYGCIIEIIL